MEKLNKALYVFLLSATLASVALVMELDFGSAQTSIEVKGILSQDTVWTKQGTPYQFKGAVGVPEGVTLTIEAGVTVDLTSYYLEVNGTLNIEGTQDNKVTIMANENPTNGLFIGWIDTYPIASGHNNIIIAYGNPTCRIENAELHSTSLFGQNLRTNASVTINNCNLLDSSVNNWGKTTITNSYVTGAVHVKGAATVTGNTLMKGIEVSGGWSDTIWAGNFLLSGNNITNPDGIAVMASGTGIIEKNNIWGANWGVSQDDGTTLSATIQSNIIRDNIRGIYLRDDSDNGVIKENTITTNEVGIYNPTYQVSVIGNSFLDNKQYDIRAGSGAVNAKDNWWGTTDRTAIANKIYDSNDDFSLGTIVYQPVLTQASINAPDPNMCPPISTTTPLPTEAIAINYLTGGQTNTALNNIEIGLTATVVTLSIIIGTLLVKAHRKRMK